MEERFILTFVFPPLWALIYPWYINTVLHRRNGMAERKRNNMLCSQKDVYATLRYTPNYIYIFTHVPHGEKYIT